MSGFQEVLAKLVTSILLSGLDLGDPFVVQLSWLLPGGLYLGLFLPRVGRISVSGLVARHPQNRVCGGYVWWSLSQTLHVCNIYAYIDPPNNANIGKYVIHGVSGYECHCLLRIEIIVYRSGCSAMTLGRTTGEMCCGYGGCQLRVCFDVCCLHRFFLSVTVYCWCNSVVIVCCLKRLAVLVPALGDVLTRSQRPGYVIYLQTFGCPNPGDPHRS